MVKEYYMPRLLTADIVALCHHFFKYIPVPYFSLYKTAFFPLHCYIETHVAHNCTNYSIVFQYAFFFEMLCEYCKHVVPINHLPSVVHCNEPVSIPVKGQAYMCTGFQYQLLQILWMCRAAFYIYVLSIRLVSYDYNFSTQISKCRRCRYV